MTDKRNAADTTVRDLVTTKGVDPVGTVWAMDRLLSTSGIYPPDHKRFLDVAQALLAAIDSQPDGRLVLEAGRGALAVQGNLVDKEEPGAARLLDICTSLGIIAVEFYPGVAPGSLHAFALQLVQAKRQADEAHIFHRFDFGDLHDSIRVRQREFGRRVNHRPLNPVLARLFDAAVDEAMTPATGGGGTGGPEEGSGATAGSGAGNGPGEGPGPGAATAPDGAAGPGAGTDTGNRLSGEAEEEVRERIEQIIAQVIERLDPTRPGDEVRQDDDFRELNQVLDLGVGAIQQALGELLKESNQQGLDFRRLIQSAELALAISDDRESVEVMMDVLRQAGEEEPESEPEEEPEEPETLSDHQFDLPALEEMALDYIGDQLTPPFLQVGVAREHLAVLTGMLLHEPTPRALVKIGQALTDLVASGLGHDEAQILAQVATRALGSRDRSQVDRVLPVLLKPLRRSKELGPARFLLATLGDKADRLPLLWPHMVNQVLLGLTVDPGDAVKRLHRMAASLPLQAMRQELPRLERQESLREGMLAKRVFDPLDTTLKPVCAALLASNQARLVGPLILKALQRERTDWPGTEALNFLGGYQSQMCNFLTRILLEGDQDTRAIRTMAGSVITTGLENLAEERRSEPFVTQAIGALGCLGIQAAEPLLRSIVGARRWLVLPVWSGPCRRAARKALNHLRRAARGEST